MKNKKVPMRRCIGCMESKPKQELIRMVAAEDGTLLLDPTGKAKGRGAYLCPCEECFQKARKRKAFFRNLEVSPSEEALNALAEEFAAYERQNS